MKHYLIDVTLVGLLAVFLFLPFVQAETAVSDITEALDRIYDLVKAVVSVVGVIALTIAGARFMFSGDNIQARESAKNMVSYAIIGLVLVWMAPLLVSFLTV